MPDAVTPARRRYRGFMSDSARWDRFAFRPDDVVISTPSKCGTTWMQTIVGMLLLDRTELGAPIGTISPRLYGHFAEHLGRCCYDGLWVGNQRTSIQQPAAIRSAPLIHAPSRPCCASFSNATNAVRTTITRTFITPPTNSSSISAQQQPTQWAPCSTPIQNAPRLPLRQRPIRKPTGDWQVCRQAFFSGVH